MPGKRKREKPKSRYLDVVREAMQEVGPRRYQEGYTWMGVWHDSTDGLKE